MGRITDEIFRRVILLSVVAVAACDPSWSLAIRQPVAPATDVQCVAAVLRADGRIDTVGAPERSEVAFALRDSAVPSGRRRGSVSIERTKDTLRTLQVAVEWYFPAAGIVADSTRTRQLAAFGREVTERIRAACSNGVPSAPTCKILGLLPPRQCEPTA